MPVTLEFHEQGRVALYHVSDPWDATDFLSLYPRDTAHRDHVSHHVHTMIDLSRMCQLPVGFLRLRHNAPLWSHRHSGALVVVGAHPLAQEAFDLIFRLVRFQHGVFFASADSAWNFLRGVIAAEMEHHGRVHEI